MSDQYYYLKTGAPHLDRILAMDETDRDPARVARHGIMCERGDAPGGVPVVLILGGAGTGKTTLALQFATEVATEKRNGGSKCCVFFYSLEQSVTSLSWAHQNFGFAADAPFEDFADPADGQIQRGRIHLCHFAPLPISGAESGHAFEDRFEQLCHMIKVLTKRSPLPPVFFIDSLNAIANSDLPRNAIYRLFALLRSQGIPAIITAETRDPARDNGSSISEDARFLSDVVMELSSEEAAGHYLTYVRICKSRIRRQALGKHLYKIRIAEAKTGKPKKDEPISRWNGGRPEGGFLVYPSLPSILSMVRAPHEPDGKSRYRLWRRGEAGAYIASLIQRGEVKPGSCFSLVGPAGTHKLALGLNLATGYLERRLKNRGKGAPRVPARSTWKASRNLLIISFGSYTAVDLAGVAWFDQRQNWSRCEPPKESPQRKWQRIEFEFKGKDPADDAPPRATQLMFRMGHLTPEECLDSIRLEIDDAHAKGSGYSAVLVWDTAQIRTGFPLLRREPLFIPTLVDFFHEMGLVSVFIGVREEEGADREMDSALESAADYRISLSHYPNPYDLAKGVFQHDAPPDGAGPRPLRLYEQLASVVIDNVTGKHYGRHPRWLMVEVNGKEKRLKCLENPECSVELRKRDLEQTRNMIATLLTAAARYDNKPGPKSRQLARRLAQEAEALQQSPSA